MAQNKVTNYYQVPDKDWYRIHFVRPRFKSNIENVLLYMASECCRIPKCTCEEYSNRYFNAIRRFPGNIDATKKTLDNWRTEIPALFSFYNENKANDITETSDMARFLHENQDLTQFLRLFLHSFQFPGGHLKPNDVRDIIQRKIKFKPAKTIIEVLLAGNEILGKENNGKEMSISAEEATYCIFNDIHVTSGKVSAHSVAKTILANRKNKIKYYNPNDPKCLSLRGKARSKGDMTRYAGDILDYMEIANLLVNTHGYFTLKGDEYASLHIFAEDTTWFDGYDKFYGKRKIESKELTRMEPLWFDYVNKSMDSNLFKTDIRSVIERNNILDVVFEDRIREVIALEDRTNKDVGDLGEAIVCGHEKMRLKVNGYDKFVRLVQIVDSPAYHPGFDIDSFEADGTEHHRYIEVKTTISKKKIQVHSFHMSSNEWNVAGTIKEHYCVYHLMLSEQDRTLFVLRNPVGLYKTDKIEAVSHNGMDISFSSGVFESTELLTWKE